MTNSLKSKGLISTLSGLSWKHQPRYGLMKRLGLVCVFDGLGCGGEKMNVESQRTELAFLNKIDTEAFAWLLVTLIKNNREVRRAIMGMVLASIYKEIRFGVQRNHHNLVCKTCTSIVEIAAAVGPDP